jgi:hypothetical protein
MWQATSPVVPVWPSPYLATMMATVLVITFWPWLTLIVPSALGLR